VERFVIRYDIERYREPLEITTGPASRRNFDKFFDKGAKLKKCHDGHSKE